MITTTIEWFDPREKLPDKNGRYMVCLEHGRTVYYLMFSTNLYDTDIPEFSWDYYKHPGFYIFDEYTHRFTELPLDNIGCWACIPIGPMTDKEEN